MSSHLGFIHRFTPGDRREATPFLLLHGTGGDENDLLTVGKAVAPGAAMLSPRGKVLENGMPRFFRRVAEGVFDQNEVRDRANELADFVLAARKNYDIPAPIALGFSNGANIAAAIMLLRPDVLAGAVLLRAMMTLTNPPRADLGGKPVLMLSGARDPIIPPANSKALAAFLEERGAEVSYKELPVGHQLSQADLTFARAWTADRSVGQEKLHDAVM